MPHQCTNCDRRFPDGSKEMLSGCPDCGGNKFQFTPAASASDDGSSGEATPSSESEQSADATSAADQAPTPNTDTSVQAPDREWPETARRPAEKDGRLGGSLADESAARAGTDAMADDFEWVEGDEDDAQASARSSVVSPDELPSHGDSTADRAGDEPPNSTGPNADGRPGEDAESTSDDHHTAPPENGRVVSEPEADQPSIEQLRAELNQQFESIKIVNPGQYELNLMELYDREEHIVSLQEDGRYVINVPESWHDS
ncbi:OapC/ArvC family zinc-ribbon domain-containing protein [Halovivax cerinus]|uniref:Zn-ribbon containing protein n=1 Tax=Halovivax cerinus TaxID=1487865 RepID=A0ABD5NSV6_9EURY|nr:Zn-ribbon containing protein [Halovivax cerinus]